MSETGDFWGFSLRVYGRPGVAEACLELQNRHGLDVNMVLFCCWAARFGSLDRSTLERARDASERWADAAVRPLRSVRTALESRPWPDLDRAEVAELRERVKKEELAAERLQQEMLERILGESPPFSSPSGLPAGRRHFGLYLTLVEAAPTPELDARLATVLEGCRDEWA